MDKNDYDKLLDGTFKDIKLELLSEIETINGCDDTIGKGSYGRVFNVEFNGAACAAKEFHSNDIFKRNNLNEKYLSNCQKCAHLRHPSIVQFFGVFCAAKPNNPPIQVMEKMNWSLTSYIETECTPNIKLPTSILLDVAAGLKHLHSRKPPIVHCYLSSNNILLTAELRAKISDVGLAQLIKGHKSKAEVFMAPELASDKSKITNADPSADMFSYGAVMLHTITQQWPESSSMHASSTNNDLNDLMGSCLDCTQRNRPNITTVLTKLKDLGTSTIAPKVEDEQELQQADKVSKNIIEQQQPQIKGSQETSKQPEEKEKSYNNQKYMKGTNEKQNLEQVSVSSQKECKTSNKSIEQQKGEKQELFEDNLQQKQSKKPKKSTDNHQTGKENDLQWHSNPCKNDRVQQKDDSMNSIDQQSNIDGQHMQDHSQKNEASISTREKLEDNDKKNDEETKQNITYQVKGFQKDHKNLKEKEDSGDAKCNRKDKSSMKSNPGTVTQRKDKHSNEKSKSEAEQFRNNQKSAKGKRDQKKTKNPPLHNHLHTNDLLEQERKDVDEQQSNGSSQHLKDDSQQSVENDSNVQPSTSTSTDGIISYKFDEHGPKVMGFYNQGNTCFFNAMLQCIHQTIDLHYAVAEGRRVYTIESSSKGPLVIEVPKNSGQLTVQLRRLFNKISKESKTISPRNLLREISERNDRFGRGTQEDSHEVLRYLLSGLREEEMDGIKQEILICSGTQGKPLTDECVDGETKLYVKECLSKVLCDIDCIFGCRLLSTTICHDCTTPLQTTERYFDISLPMPEIPASEGKSLDKTQCSGALSQRSKSQKKKSKRKGKQKATWCDTSPTQAYSIPSEESSMIPEAVTSQNMFNLHLQKYNLSYRCISGTADLKFKTTLENCLLDFTSLTTLDENNKFICQTCSIGKPNMELRRVSKQILIHNLSPVLIFHIKRFHIGRYHVTKDNRHMSFPHILDVAPFCTNDCFEKFADTDKKILYGLYAVVEHNGSSLHNGHYTACVRRRQPVLKAKHSHSAMKHPMQGAGVEPIKKYDQKAAEEGRWCRADDSCITGCHDSTLNLDCKAYLLFYEMLPDM